MVSSSWKRTLINLRTRRNKLLSLFFHTNSQRCLLVNLFLRGVFPDVLRDLHGAEVWATHGTKMCELGAFLGQRLVVVFARDFRIEREIELILPTEFEPRLRQSVLAIPRSWDGRWLSRSPY